MSGLKVGELYAELGIDDLTDKQLAQASRRMQQALSKMDGAARLDLDDSRFDSVLGAAVRQAERAATTYTAELDVDASGMSDGLDSAASDGEAGVLDMIGGWATVGAGAAVGAGLVIGNALMDAIGEVIDRGKVTDKLAAQMGVDSDSNWLGRAAGDLWLQGYGDSIEEGGQVMRRAMQHGLVPEDIGQAELEKVSAKVLDIASAFGVGFEEITRAGGQMLRTGLASSYDDAMDIISQGMIQGGDAADDFLDTLREYSTEFRAMGIDGQTATGLLVQGLKAGARDADIVADAFKEVGIRIQSGDSAEAIQRIGLNYGKVVAEYKKGGPAAAAALDTVLDKLRDYEARTGDMATVFEIGGTQAEDMQDAFLALDPSNAVDTLGQIAGASDQLSQTLNDNFGTKWETALRHFDLGALADTFSRDGFDGVRRQLGEGVDSLKAIWDEYGPAVTEILGEGWDEIVAWWEDPEGGQKVLDQAETWWNDTAKPWLGDAAGNALSGAWNAALGIAGDWLSDPGNWTSFIKNFSFPGAQFYDTVKGWVQDTVEATPEWLGGMVDNVERFITEQLGPTIAGNIGHLWDGLVEGFKVALNAVIGLWNGLSIPAFDIGPWEVPTSPWTTQSVGPFTIGGWDFPDIPTFHTGGVVPGNYGDEVLALLQPGETVRTREQEASLFGRLGDTPRATPENGTGRSDEAAITAMFDQLVASIHLDPVRL